MTKENEFKLLKIIAQSHLGDSRFEKKWGIKISSERKVSDEEVEIIEAELEQMNKTYEQEFINCISKKLEEENISEEFYFDLVYGGCSIPVHKE